MNWLNYHHLHYFWVVACEGSITAACAELNLAPSTISGQLKLLEEQLGNELFARSGRGLALTEFGTHVFRYAEEIFNIGRELMDYTQGRPTTGPIHLDIGVTEVVPKLVVRKLVEPALRAHEAVHLTIREGHTPELLADLALHHLDLVITDSPATDPGALKGYSHLFGESDVALFGTAEFAERIGDGFPQSIDGLPILLPTSQSVLRRLLNHWFDQRELHPVIVGEFQDSAQLKAFGEHGMGIFPAPAVIAKDIERQYGVQMLGLVDGVREGVYGVTVERRVEHPVVAALFEAARDASFGWSK